MTQTKSKAMNTFDEMKMEYDNITRKYAEEFTKKYFGDTSVDSYWVSDKFIGGILYINDFYFNFDTIKYAIDNDVDENDLFEWYDHLTEYGIGNVEVSIPTLEKWHKNKENQTQKLEWELLTHYKKVFDFSDKDFVTTKKKPTENGYYLVIFTTLDGIYQRAIEWKDNAWMKYTAEVLHMIARTKSPITVKNSHL